jgi:hypothetical protein
VHILDPLDSFRDPLFCIIQCHSGRCKNGKAVIASPISVKANLCFALFAIGMCLYKSLPPLILWWVASTQVARSVDLQFTRIAGESEPDAK